MHDIENLLIQAISWAQFQIKDPTRTHRYSYTFSPDYKRVMLEIRLDSNDGPLLVKGAFKI